MIEIVVYTQSIGDDCELNAAAAKPRLLEILKIVYTLCVVVFQQ